MSINSLEMSINSLEKYISNRLTNHLMRTGLLSDLERQHNNLFQISSINCIFLK